MFVPDKPFQSSVMFADEARSLPKSGAVVPASLANKTRLERFARDKHSSLLQKSVNYGRKKCLIVQAPGAFKNIRLGWK